jgi:hypothetical protein
MKTNRYLVALQRPTNPQVNDFIKPFVLLLYIFSRSLKKTCHQRKVRQTM